MLLNNRFQRLFEEEPGGIGGGAPAAPAASPEIDFGSEDTFRAFVGTLPEDQQGLDLLKNTKSLSSLVDQTINAQSALGKRRLEAPNADWTEEQWTEFESAIRPETEDAYQFEEKYTFGEGESAIEHSLSEADTAELRAVANELGLSTRQASKLAAKWAERSVQANGDLSGQIDAAVESARTAIRAEWGDQYEVNHRSANEAFEILAKEIPELKELVGWSPVVENHPGIMKLFHKLAPMVQDAGMITGGQSGGFGEQTVASLRAQLADFDAQHEQLINADPTRLSIDDKIKREEILNKRTEFYKKLWPNE